jgi:hypothetical protein
MAMSRLVERRDWIGAGAHASPPLYHGEENQSPKTRVHAWDLAYVVASHPKPNKK